LKYYLLTFVNIHKTYIFNSDSASVYIAYRYVKLYKQLKCNKYFKISDDTWIIPQGRRYLFQFISYNNNVYFFLIYFYFDCLLLFSQNLSTYEVLRWSLNDVSHKLYYRLFFIFNTTYHSLILSSFRRIILFKRISHVEIFIEFWSNSKYL